MDNPVDSSRANGSSSRFVVIVFSFWRLNSINIHFSGIHLVAIRTGDITTSTTWCGGQVPTFDICNKNDECNLLILPDVTLTIGSTADQPLFNSIKSIDNRGTLAVAVSFRLTTSQIGGSIHVVGGTLTLV
jgi:hypothetical protein